jgi:uncharacterized membrane protein
MNDSKEENEFVKKQERKTNEKNNLGKKFSNWLKDPHSKIFLGILILGFIIRLYYFFQTSSQPLWWDEADYMAYAKAIAGQGFWTVTPEHSSILSYIAGFLFKIGFSEIVIKFILEFIPSVLLIILVYKICSIAYKDKRIALIVSFLMATLWTILFNSMRFHLGVPALLFGFLAIYVFFQGYEKNQKIFGKINPKWAIPLTVFFVALTYSIRRGYFLFGFFFLIHMLLTRKFKKIIKDKYNWLAIGLVIILVFLGESFIFVSQIEDIAGTYTHTDKPISFKALGVFSSFFANISNSWLSILSYLFWFGLIIMVLNIFLSLGHIRNSRKIEKKSDLFFIISIILTLAFFIFILRPINNFGEPRLYFPLLLATFVCISKGTLTLSDYLKKYNKHIVVVLIIVLIGYGGYYQIQHADMIIKSKLNTYKGTREAGLFLKEISQTDEIIIAKPVTQIAYYSERKSIQPEDFVEWKGKGTEVPFELFLEKLKQIPEVGYILVSFSQPNHPYWMQKIEYARNQQGQTVMAQWQIPFMNTTIDFRTGQQDIKKEAVYEEYGLKFELLTIKGQDVFIYKVQRIQP